MYSYTKQWYTFGIIESIYYSKDIGYILCFTNKAQKLLHECSLNDFTYTSDKTAYVKAMETLIVKDHQYVVYDDVY